MGSTFVSLFLHPSLPPSLPRLPALPLKETHSRHHANHGLGLQTRHRRLCQLMVSPLRHLTSWWCLRPGMQKQASEALTLQPQREGTPATRLGHHQESEEIGVPCLPYDLRWVARPSCRPSCNCPLAAQPGHLGSPQHFRRHHLQEFVQLNFARSILLSSMTLLSPVSASHALGGALLVH